MLVPFAWLSFVPLLAGTSPIPVNHHVVQSQAIVRIVLSDTGAATSDPTALTHELLAHYIAVKKELGSYWKSHPDLHKTAQSTEHQPNIEVSGQQVPVVVFDYPTLVTKDTALANIFKRNKFAPHQFEPTQVAAYKAVAVLFASSGAPDPTTVAGKNVVLVKQHRQELHDVGIDFQQQQGGGGGSNDDLNP